MGSHRKAKLPARCWWPCALGAALAAVAVVTGQTPCQGPRRAEPDVPAVRREAGVAWVRVPSAGGAEVLGLPVVVSVEQGRIRCRRTVPGPRVLVQTFQRRGNEVAYGVYALAGAKDDLLLEPPLDGDPVVWPTRDAATALAYQLELAGLDAAGARRFVQRSAAVLLAVGNRVILTFPGDVAMAGPSWTDTLRGSGPPQVLLVAIELELP
jgi:hypothetical protein